MASWGNLLGFQQPGAGVTGGNSWRPEDYNAIELMLGNMNAGVAATPPAAVPRVMPSPALAPMRLPEMGPAQPIQGPEPVMPVDITQQTGGPNMQSTAPAAGFSQILSPPATQQELAGRQQGWMDTISTALQDPNMSQVLMTVGARLLQGTRPGQSTLGGIGEAAQLGMLHHNMLGENARKAGLEERKLKGQEALQQSQIEENKSQTAERVQKTEQAKDEFPLKLKKMQREVANLEIQGRFDAARALREEFYAANQERITNSEINARNAQANSANAAAGSHAAEADLRRSQTRLNAQKEGAGATLLGDTGGAELVYTGKSAAKEHKDQVKQQQELVKAEHPEWNAQQVAAEVSKRTMTAKSNYLQIAQKVLESPEGHDEVTLRNARAVVAKAMADASGGATPDNSKPDQALPMPASAKDAVKGAVYNTARGPAKWDGQKFVPVGR